MRKRTGTTRTGGGGYYEAGMLSFSSAQTLPRRWLIGDGSLGTTGLRGRRDRRQEGAVNLLKGAETISEFVVRLVFE